MTRKITSDYDIGDFAHARGFSSASQWASWTLDTALEAQRLIASLPGPPEVASPVLRDLERATGRISASLADGRLESALAACGIDPESLEEAATALERLDSEIRSADLAIESLRDEITAAQEARETLQELLDAR